MAIYELKGSDALEKRSELFALGRRLLRFSPDYNLTIEVFIFMSFYYVYTEVTTEVNEIPSTSYTLRRCSEEEYKKMIIGFSGDKVEVKFGGF